MLQFGFGVAGKGDRGGHSSFERSFDTLGSGATYVKNSFCVATQKALSTLTNVPE